MSQVQLSAAQRDALSRLEQAIIDYQLEQQGFTSRDVRIAAAQALVALEQQGKVALTQDRAYFDPQVDLRHLARSALSGKDDRLSQPSPAAQALALAYSRYLHQERLAQQQHSEQILAQELVATIHSLYGPQEIEDPEQIVTQMLDQTNADFKNACEVARLRALAPLVSAFIADNQELNKPANFKPDQDRG